MPTPNAKKRRQKKNAAVRQDELLDVAMRHFLVKGYADTSVQDIIDEVGIAKGTFYHHYPSKPALLDALVARTVAQAMAVLEPMVAAPDQPALGKLHTIFRGLGAWKTARREQMMELARGLYADANLPLLLRHQRRSADAMGPLLGRIIAQGVAEGVFDTGFPEHAGRLLLELGNNLGRDMSEALVSGRPYPRERLEQDIDAWNEATRRLLGAAPGVLQLVDKQQVLTWFEPAPEDRS